MDSNNFISCSLPLGIMVIIARVIMEVSTSIVNSPRIPEGLAAAHAD